MISHFDRRHAVELIDEAVTAGARQHKACAILELSARTYQRWTQDVAVLSDARPSAARPVPSNKLSVEERQVILAVSNSPAFRSLFYYLYLVLDLYSRKIVAWEVHESEASELAAQLIHKACLTEGIVAQPLVLHSDNGSPMKGTSMLETLRWLGVTPSFSRPRVSNDNAYAESVFRTCKYRPDYPVNGFASIDEARAWVLSFSRWYNTEHKHSGLKFTTPEQRHTGVATAILAHRKHIYREAREHHPNRWRGDIRNWELPEKVWLNPEKEQPELNKAA